jgi:lipopolysaccharide biosynthesis glycosyltransferase/tetratricopeptide (TPR) repeat protein
MADNILNTVSATVAEIDRLFRTGKFQQSNDEIEHLLSLVKPTSYMLFCRGRNLRYLGDLDGAATWFDQSLQTTPTFPWSHYERAAVHFYRGEFLAAGRQASAFLATRTPESAADLNAVHKDTLLKMAHSGFALDRAATRELYELLLSFGVRDYLLELRLTEGLAERGQMLQAHERLLDLDQRYRLDPWGMLAWVRVLRTLGKLDEARDKAAQILTQAAKDSMVRVHACQRLLDLGCIDLVAPHIAEMQALIAGHPGHPARDLGFRFACLAGGEPLQLLYEELQTEPDKLKHVKDSTLVDAMFALAKYGADADPLKRELGDLIVSHVYDTRSFTSGIVLALLHHHQFLGQYQEAGKLIATIEDPLVLDHPDIALRRFEILCRTNRLSDALVMYETTISKRRLSGWESTFVLRFLAEMGMDDVAIDHLEKILVSGHEVPRDEYLVLQVCRRAQQHDRVFAALHGRVLADGLDKHADLMRLLIDDLCISQGVPAFTRFGTVWEASPDNLLLIKSDGPLPQQPAATGCAFLCTNRAYFFSALTFFMSCAAHSPGSIHTVDWYVFLDDNVPESWEEALHTVARAAEIRVRVVREPDFIPSDVDHMEAYGIFTGGVKLSRAAYFRIYAAVYLYGLNRYKLACYFDTDIICTGDLQPMLAPDFGDDLLLARLEEVNDDVIAAAERSGADPYRYFNSGVLALNFASSDVVECLQQAIWLSEHEPARLTFHDQCALNIAFIGRAGLLQERLNFFLRPNKPDALEGIEDAVLLHFLDRPKPWDIAFRLKTRRYWEPHAREVRAVLDETMFQAIVAAANGLKLQIAG